MTDQQFQKLPKWAQQHITNLQRERDAAINALNESVDNQTETPFYYEEHPCTGEQTGPVMKRFYIQTHRIHCNYKGIHVSIRAYDDRLEISWGGGRNDISDVAMIPESYQRIRLVSKDDMRD